MILTCYLAGMPLGALHGYAQAWVDGGRHARCLTGAAGGALIWPATLLLCVIGRPLGFNVNPVRTMKMFLRGQRTIYEMDHAEFLSRST